MGRSGGGGRGGGGGGGSASLKLSAPAGATERQAAYINDLADRFNRNIDAHGGRLEEFVSVEFEDTPRYKQLKAKYASAAPRWTPEGTAAAFALRRAADAEIAKKSGVIKRAAVKYMEAKISGKNASQTIDILKAGLGQKDMIAIAKTIWR